MSAKPSVREKFSLEFVTGGDAEANALKSLFGAAKGLPDLILVDPDAVQAPVKQEAVQQAEVAVDNNANKAFAEPSFSNSADDSVAELRMLFGSVR